MTINAWKCKFWNFSESAYSFHYLKGCVIRSKGSRYNNTSLKSDMGSPKVESSQSRTAMTRFSVGWKMQLSTRKSPWATDVGSSWSFRFFGSQSISSSISSHFLPSISAARYCFVHVFICLYRETDLLRVSVIGQRLSHRFFQKEFQTIHRLFS